MDVPRIGHLVPKTIEKISYIREYLIAIILMEMQEIRQDIK